MSHYIGNCPRDVVATPAGIAGAALHSMRRWLQTQQLKKALQRERASLLSMSDAQLRDIGIDRAAAEQEAGRNDIPAARRL